MTTPNNKQAGERMRHSSGKWNAANRDDGMFVEAHPNFNDGHAICECFGPDAVANARLISAAPELLEVVRAFLTVDNLRQYGALIRLAKTVVAKAGGRLP